MAFSFTPLHTFFYINSRSRQQHAFECQLYSMDGFYCGYRAAYNMMESINPLVQIQHVDKILTMEYHLGYIKPYSEVERLRDMAA